MPFCENGNIIRDISFDDNLKSKMYNNSSTMTYSKCVINFYSDGNYYTSRTGYWNDYVEDFPSISKPYHDFLGGYTEGGTQVYDLSSLTGTGVFKRNGNPPSISLHARGQAQTCTVYFSWNRLAYDGINQNYPKAFTVNKGTTFRDALSKYANSYLCSYSKYHNRFGHPDWEEGFDGDMYIRFPRVGGSTNNTGDIRYDKTYSDERIVSDVTLYPSFEDYAIFVGASEGSDLKYGNVDGSGGCGRIYVNYNDVT